MLPFVPDPTTWPFAPGEGPFRIKGTAYRGHLEFVAAEVPGGLAGMLAAMNEPLATYFRGSFLAASFYDLMPLVLAAAPCAAAMGLSAPDFVNRRSRVQAPKDLTGVYRFLVAMVPTRTVAKKLPQLFTQILDFGEAKVVRDAPGEVDASIEAIPAAIAPWLCTVMASYGEAALQTSGAKRATVVATLTAWPGQEHGVPLAGASLKVRWG